MVKGEYSCPCARHEHKILPEQTVTNFTGFNVDYINIFITGILLLTVFSQ